MITWGRVPYIFQLSCFHSFTLHPPCSPFTENLFMLSSEAHLWWFHLLRVKHTAPRWGSPTTSWLSSFFPLNITQNFCRGCRIEVIKCHNKEVSEFFILWVFHRNVIISEDAAAAAAAVVSVMFNGYPIDRCSPSAPALRFLC